MTEKLYYKNAYTESFEARVISSFEENGRFVAVLDRTAFFPEEGGQYSDTGTINGHRVDKVIEKDGIIYHYTDVLLEENSVAYGKIEFADRYEKMQSHTAEHILSGLIHKKYGLDNVGFHLGADDVTLDVGKVRIRPSGSAGGHNGMKNIIYLFHYLTLVHQIYIGMQIF